LSNTARQTIVVFNPISGHGHLDSWNALFVSVFLKAGWNVFAITKDINALLDRLGEDKSHNSGMLTTHQFPSLDQGSLPTVKNSNLIQQLRIKGNLSGLSKKIVDLGSTLNQRPSQLIPPLKILVLCSLHFTKFYLFRKVKNWFLRPARARDSLQDLFAVEDILKSAQIEPDLIFHMYLDAVDFDNESELFREAKLIKKWAGVRFAPKRTDRKFYASHPELVGICFLDPAQSQYFSSKIGHIHFSTLPDITDTTLPLTQSNLAKTILSQANGRKIIFLGGMIGGQKNIRKWYQLIAKADPNKYFFLQVGAIHTQSMNMLDLLSFYRMMCSEHANLMVMPFYLESEAEFNELISISDSLFAVYRNFSDSSNMLAKAAAFSKPILVSNQYLMGRRVIEYGIGIASDEEDANQMMQAIENMPSSKDLTKNFERYRQDFSISTLSEALYEFVNRVTFRAINNGD
jgi:glycosyltransferase involved in cell wall biosynthesis